MTEEWRTLLYPLGFLASLAFFLRFIVQWVQSEKRKTSHVSPIFWKISFAGNICLLVHCLIQVQIHLCLVQGANLVFATRNLHLMQHQSDAKPMHHVLRQLILVLGGIVLAFVVQGYLCFGFVDWVRTPNLPWSQNPGEELSLAWHLLGSVGIVIFGARFWLQWWLAEKKKDSYLGRGFWWTSLTGAAIALVYFIRLKDPVNILGTGTGLVPAIRNLMLIRQANRNKTHA